MITATTFPTQGRWALEHCRVEVCFNFDPSVTLHGFFVRHDTEEPYIGIIQLDDGRYVLETECQFRPVPPAHTEL
jgi:hypothetical protein